jgi:hypothetical protein
MSHSNNKAPYGKPRKNDSSEDEDTFEEPEEQRAIP